MLTGKRMRVKDGAFSRCCKRRRVVELPGIRDDNFEALPDDLIVFILCKLGSSAATPSDLLSLFITCKGMKELGKRRVVLSSASVESLAVRAEGWCDSAHQFLKRCANAGNYEACYILGMIEFYCLKNRAVGTSLMARVAVRSHAGALYSLAVIQFNGSGGWKKGKDPPTGVALCARAASLGHLAALRELGHCLPDGYGILRDSITGWKLLVRANAFELAAVMSAGRATDQHPANRFLVEWFRSRGGPGPGGLRLCSYTGCGRPETRWHEFRRCSDCRTVNYCSKS